MDRLNRTIAVKEPGYLLASNVITEAIAVSLEPENGVLPAGAVLYRKTGVLYAPAAAANITTGNNLVVLAAETDSLSGVTEAIAAKAYRKGNFIAGKVLVKNGSKYEGISAANEVVLRQQGITLSPMDDWSSETVVEADNSIGE